MYIPVVAHSLYIALACIVSASVGSASLRAYISADLFCFVWYLCSVAVLQASSILGIHYCQRCNIAWFMYYCRTTMFCRMRHCYYRHCCGMLIRICLYSISMVVFTFDVWWSLRYVAPCLYVMFIVCYRR